MSNRSANKSTLSVYRVYRTGGDGMGRQVGPAPYVVASSEKEAKKKLCRLIKMNPAPLNLAFITANKVGSVERYWHLAHKANLGNKAERKLFKMWDKDRGVRGR